MCGIAGLIGQPDPNLLRTMLARLVHRGPDDHHAVIVDSVGLACARLSLLDLDRGGQPLHSSGGRLVVAFNGEIYNHAALRAGLRARHGCAFRGHSDTEVLLTGFEYEGPAFLSRLEGMYALAITDGTTLWLARDSFGMKPLFYWWSSDGRRLLFGSEIKALLAEPRVPRTLDRAALVELATFGFVLGRHTLFASVAQVAPGELLAITRMPDGLLQLDRRAVPVAATVSPCRTEAEAIEHAAALLRESVHEQMTADHPVGCFASGGIDSSLVVGLAREAFACATFTAGDQRDPSGFELARRVAAEVDAPHLPIALEPDAYIAAVPAAVAATELPVGPTLVFMCAPGVRRVAKAVLCGDGADELFAGYGVHAKPEEMLKRYRIGLAHVARSGAVDAGDLDSSRAVLDWLDQGDAGERQRRAYDFLGGDQLTNYHLWLWDRGSMAAGLEVRLPFLNTRLRALAQALPADWRLRDGTTKVVLRELLARVLSPALADAVIGQPKRAAWYSGRRSLRAWEQRTVSLVDADHRRTHPFGAIFPFASSLVLFDVFLAIFVGNHGLVPEPFDLDALYGAGREELARLHRAAW